MAACMYTVKTNVCFRYSQTCFKVGYVSKERRLVTFEDTFINNHIKRHISRRDRFNDTIVGYLKNYR